jgi:hypothetical protein
LRDLFNFIFDQITDPLSLPIHPLYEWAILSIVGFVAYKCAFRLVGDIYDTGIIQWRFLGSLLHWSIRLFIFVPSWAIVYWTIVVGQWIWRNGETVLSIIIGAIGIFAMFYRDLQRRAKSSKLYDENGL